MPTPMTPNTRLASTSASLAKQSISPPSAPIASSSNIFAGPSPVMTPVRPPSFSMSTTPAASGPVPMAAMGASHAHQKRPVSSSAAPAGSSSAANAFADLLGGSAIAMGKPLAPSIPLSSSPQRHTGSQMGSSQSMSGLAALAGAKQNAAPSAQPAATPASTWGNLDFLEVSAGAPAGGSPIPAHAVPGVGAAMPAADSANVDIFDVSYLGSQAAAATAKLKQQQQEQQTPHDDNPLGILARPASQAPTAATSASTASPQSALGHAGSTVSPSLSPTRSQQQQQQQQHQQQQQQSGTRSRMASNTDYQGSKQHTDKDFAIAQIMSMGFDADAAGSALEMTSNNVEAAIDLLVQNRDAESQLRSSPSKISPSRSSAATPRKQPSRDSHNARRSDDDYDLPHESDWGDHGGQSGMQASGAGTGDTAAKIMESASALGFSVFRNAKTILDYSKKKIAEVIEKARDDNGALGGSAGGRYADDDGDARRGDREGYESWGGSYRDQVDSDRAGASPQAKRQASMGGSDDEDGGEREVPLRRSMTAGSADTSPRKAGSPSAPHSRQGTLQPAINEKLEANLLGDVGEAVGFASVPAQQHRPQPAPQPAPQQQAQAQQQQQQQQAPTPAPPKQAAKPSRPTVHATPDQISASNAFKERGNELFKQGQFGDAEAQYTSAISALPSGHALLVPLLNNRAASRLKTGHHKEAVGDCDAVQALEPGDVKSLLRRATAYEALEKWDLARDDYRRIMAVDAGVKGVSDGLSRCNKAFRAVAASNERVLGRGPGVGASASASVAPKAVSAQVQTAVDQAVQKLRDQSQLAEQEDNLKLALKDQTDDKILQWRRGKEDNLRALISSLDTVLWPELGWKTINLSELITPAQVKVRYMRAVGKVHPDKLTQETSVEHRLIANGVFATLNKAWDSFKAQNGLA
ncbi:hypothetical protein BC831DRAFT_450745 [Entophlyctis helioformis]|nr:hypothetical protein BC831DRAFT_450745 [Entophlyctis helioformis]